MDNTTILNITITSISAIGTLISALIYYHTLKEIRKQRETTYKPHIIIEETPFVVKAFRKGEVTFPSLWDNNNTFTKEIEEYKEEKYCKSNFNLKSYNIGFGTAKKITGKFSYDIDAFIEQLQRLNSITEGKKQIFINKDKYTIEFKTNNEDLSYLNKIFLYKNEAKRIIDYILPVNVDTKFTSINIPNSFLELLNVQVYLTMINHDNKKINFEIEPELFFNYSYYDISNKKYSKRIKISIEFTMLSTISYSGNFKITEVY